ncbi:MAG: sulfatase-like hydrolase/transferase [Opitutales bacterium]|nr:sulfatase-like hydrolase/transferase [Opitutales bacterium]
MQAETARTKGPPNIILIVSDEHQAAACGCYGSTVRQTDGRSPTPAIDALAADGVRFDSMYCPAPLCAPCRASYMTGKYPHQTAAIYHKMQRREPGLTRFPGVAEGIPGMGEYFRKAGYRTAALGKMHVHGETLEGWDLGFDERDLRIYTSMPGKHYSDLKNGDVNRRYREMRPYLDQTYREIDPQRFSHAPKDLIVRQNGVNQHFLETLVEHEDEMLDHLVTDRSIDFIERNTSAGKPFFIHVGLEKPHRPWTIHQKFLDRFNPDDMPLPATIAEWTKKGQFPFSQAWCHSDLDGDKARRSTAAYYACASSVDDCVGRIMERCRELDILDNTIIVYTSDHGESLYEHGLIEKHNMLDPAAKVPFIIRAPWAIKAGEICNEPVNLIDMIPTFCDMTGISSPSSLEGVSLIPTISGKADPDRLVFSEFYQPGSVTRPEAFLPVRMGLNKKYKYVYTHAAADQLYLRDHDDEEHLRNRAFESEYEAITSKLRLCTLANWQLDEYPQLSASVSVSEDGVALEWEDAGAGASYDVYRAAVADPRKADRIATGLERRSYVDTEADPGKKFHYWVLGHHNLDQPFVDPRGNSRYGTQPILSSEYPFRLPISPRIEVTVENEVQKKFSYEPLLGLTFGQQGWIYIGNKPGVGSDEVSVTGPVTLLSSEAAESDYAFSAEIRTARAGYEAQHTLMLLFNYHTMNRHYQVGLQKDGTLGLWKRTSEWTQEELAVKQFSGVRPADWHKIEVRKKGSEITVLMDGEPALSYTDPEPLAPARFGFDAPLYLGSAQLRSVSLILNQ